MKDKFKREINYLRLSLTSNCNLRCMYCIPEENYCQNKDETLSEKEIIDICKILSDMGIDKIRLTGGEPLLRKNILQIIEEINKIPEIKTLAITTNGLKLSEMADDIKKAGVKDINISLDTLDKDKYEFITRGGRLDLALKGIEKSLRAGFRKIKLNTVLIGGFNDDEIEDFSKITYDYPVDVRFIELMPMPYIQNFGKKSYITTDIVKKRLKNLEKIQDEKNSTAKLYKLPNAMGRIGLISTVSDKFCDNCNRIRITSDGKIKPCLHSKFEISIKNLSENEIRERLKFAIFNKDEERGPFSKKNINRSRKTMNQVGG